MRAAALVACGALAVAQRQPAAAPPVRANFFVQVEPLGPGPADMRGSSGSGLRISSASAGATVHVWARSNDIYFGCDVLLRPLSDRETYLATFQPLSLGAAEIVGKPGSVPTPDAPPWTYRPPAAYPPPQRVRAGETLSIDLTPAVEDGRRLVGYLELGSAQSVSALEERIEGMTTPQLQALGARLVGEINRANAAVGEAQLGVSRRYTRGQAAPARPAVVSPSPPRDFSAEDAELEMVRPSVRIDGEEIAESVAPDARGPLPWLYLPGRGRLIFSLVPRPGFQQAGAVEGRALEVRSGKNAITLQCPLPIAPEYETYIIYVRHDAVWQPDAAQTGSPLLGTLDPAEVTSDR